MYISTGVRSLLWAISKSRYFFAGLNRLEVLGHQDVRFTVHEDAGHDVWKRVYGGRDLYDWLLSHSLEGAALQPDAAAGGEPTLESRLEIVDVASGERRTVLRVGDHLEAPNWSRDGDTLVYNSGGRLYEIPVAGGRPALLDTGFATRCNNDHGFSPDGRYLLYWHNGATNTDLRVLPLDGQSEPFDLVADDFNQFGARLYDGEVADELDVGMPPAERSWGRLPDATGADETHDRRGPHINLKSQ